MNELQIRSFNAADREVCLALFESNVPRCFLPAERSEFAEFLDALPGPYFVVQRGEDIVGCGGYALEKHPGRVDLCWGMIRADLHGRGLGRMLTRRRIEAAQAHPGIREIVLQTSQQTTGFYESLGFQIAQVEKNGFGPGLDRCEMRLQLLEQRRPDHEPE